MKGLLAFGIALALTQALPGEIQTEPDPEIQPAISLDSPLWEQRSSRDGIALYEADYRKNGIVPFKAVMTIPGTIEEVSAVLEDISRRGDWVMHFGESHLVEKSNDYQQTEYLRMNMPWPVSDRTTLVQVDISVSEDKKTAVIAARSVDCCIPEGLPDKIRAKVYASTFQMTQMDDQVEIVSLIFIDPRGWLPKWAVNQYTTVVARNTLTDLRRQVAKNLYDEETLKDLTRRIQGYESWSKKAAVSSNPHH